MSSSQESLETKDIDSQGSFSKNSNGSPIGSEGRDQFIGFPTTADSGLVADPLLSPVNRHILQPVPQPDSFGGFQSSGFQSSGFQSSFHSQSSFRSQSDSEATTHNIESGEESPLGVSRPDRLELDRQSVVSDGDNSADAVAILAEDHGISRDQMTERIWALEHYFAHSMREPGGSLDKRLNTMHDKIPSIKSYSTVLCPLNLEQSSSSYPSLDAAARRAHPPALVPRHDVPACSSYHVLSFPPAPLISSMHRIQSSVHQYVPAC
eukprot:2776395-Rhodomonas_salina.3